MEVSPTLAHVVSYQRQTSQVCSGDAGTDAIRPFGLVLPQYIDIVIQDDKKF